MSAIGKVAQKFNGIADAVGELDPIGGAIMKATNPLNLFGGDSLSKTGGKSSVPGAPAMPGGGGIDDILARLGGTKKENAFDTSGVGDLHQAGKGQTSGDAGQAGPAGGAGGDPMGGMGNMLQGIMGIVGKLLPMIMGFL